MKPVKLISFKEETVMAEWPHSEDLRVVNMSPNFTWTEDGRVLFKDRDMNTTVIPITKFSKLVITDDELFYRSHSKDGYTVEDCYVAVDFSSSDVIKNYIQHHTKRKTEDLAAKWQLEKDWVSRLEKSLSIMTKAPWYIRLKWLFTGVRVDV